MHNKAIRLENMRRLIKEAGSIKKLADRTAEHDPDGKGVPASHISNVHNRTKVKGKPREIGDKTAAKLERGMSKPGGWMDVVHEGADAPLLTGVVDPTDLTSVLAPRRRRFSVVAKELTPEQMEDIVVELHEAIDDVLSKMDGYKKSNEVVMKSSEHGNRIAAALRRRVRCARVGHHISSSPHGARCRVGTTRSH